jgi:hypothetical protein
MLCPSADEVLLVLDVNPVYEMQQCEHSSVLFGSPCFAPIGSRNTCVGQEM